MQRTPTTAGWERLGGSVPISTILRKVCHVNGGVKGEIAISKTEELREAAMRYARIGLRVFPCRVGGKEPAGDLVPHGCHDASTDLEQIRRWWSREAYNIGIATGGGIVVIDTDEHPERGKDGHAAKSMLEQLHAPLPVTVTAITGGGGKHYFFLCEDPRITVGKDVDVRVHKDDPRILPDGLDYRGNGGYVIAAPSVHPTTGMIYEWEPEHALGEIEMQPLPNWMCDVLLADRNRPRGNSTRTEETATGLTKTIREGGRNDELFRRACGLRDRGYDFDEIHAAISEVNKRRCKPPLGDAEVRVLCRSACRYEPAPLGGFVQSQRGIAQKTDDAFAAFGFYSVPDLTEEERRPPEFIIDGMIPVGLTFLSGAPKTRKSFLALLR